MPVLPVMPCVITRVFLSMRMLIAFAGVLRCSCFFLSPFGLLCFLLRLCLCLGLGFFRKLLCFFRCRLHLLRSRLGCFLFHGGNHFLGRLGHVVSRDDRQARVLQDLLAEILIRAFHAHDQRNRQLHL